MAGLDIDEALVRKLADLLNETGLSEIEFEADQCRIRVARSLTQSATVEVAAPAAAAPAPVEAPAAPAETRSNINAITAPMVGTAYLASEPGAPPFVKVGDTVSEGQTLLIIEAMKVMNPLPSPRSGRVTAILIGDGDPCEFGEPLIVIE